MADDKRPVVMAEIGAPHGVRGAVRLTVFAEDPLAIRRYNPFEDEAGRRFRIVRLTVVGKSIVAELDGVADRNTAQTLVGTRLLVPRNRLPRPDEDEYYYVDLIGLEARDVSGNRLGQVTGVADYGAGDILEIAGERTILVPFTRTVVPEVDIAGGTLTVDPPAGLIDDDPPVTDDAPGTDDSPRKDGHPPEGAYPHPANDR